LREVGYGAHYMGCHPLYLIARGIRHTVTWPYLVGGIAMIMAYFVAWLQGRERLPDPPVIRYIHRTQLRQLARLLVGKQAHRL
jgi:hypothetical protein